MNDGELLVRPARRVSISRVRSTNAFVDTGNGTGWPAPAVSTSAEEVAQQRARRLSRGRRNRRRGRDGYRHVIDRDAVPALHLT